MEQNLLKKNEDRIQDLKGKYGRIYSVTTTLVDEEGEDKEATFIFKKPLTKDYDRFLKDASNKPSQAFKNLVLSCIVSEEKEELEKTIKEYPASPSSLSKELLRLMGISDNVNLKIL